MQYLIILLLIGGDYPKMKFLSLLSPTLKNPQSPSFGEQLSSFVSEDILEK